MATGHSISGLLAGTQTAIVLGVGPGQPLYWGWVAVVTGATLLPDLDMKGTTVDRMWGPVTGGWRPRVFGKRRTLIPGLWSLIRPLVGGHRRGSHSLVGLLVLMGGLWLCSHWDASSAVVVALAVGLFLRAGCLVVTHLTDWSYKPRYWLWNLLASALAGLAFYRLGAGLPGWAILALAAGAAVHIVGDMVTDAKVGFGWPFNSDLTGLPKWLAFKAGGWFEHAFMMPMMIVATVATVTYQRGAWDWGAVGALLAS